MDYRRKVYHRNENNEERIKEIRESIRVRSSSKKLCNASYKKTKRFRERDDVQNHMKNGAIVAKQEYEEKCEYLNTLNVLLLETNSDVLTDTNIFEDLCNLALVFLKDDHPCIRAMCFHIIRKSLLLERHLVYLLRSHVDIYMVRAIDLQIENEQERIEAFKLITWMMKIYDGSTLKMMIDDAKLEGNGKKYAFPKSIMQPIVSIALAVFQKEKSKESEIPDQNKEKSYDRMSMSCVGLFLEFCLSEPDLILEMAGTDWMVRVLTGVSTLSRRIVLLVSHVLVFWLDNPHIRQKADLHMVLEQIFAPLVEYGLFQKKDNVPLITNQKVDDNVYDVLENFKASFMVLLRSWPGLFACAAIGPNSSIIGTSPLRLLEYLGLGTVENENLVRIREIIVEMCCEFVDLPYASTTFESWDEALVFYKSMHLPDKYKSSLKNDFVIAQNDARLRNDVNRTNPSIDPQAAFRCLSTFILINASLPQSLARLILAHPDSSSGLKATLLLADMLRNAPSHVPVGWRAPVLSMPTLVQSACESLIQSRASAAINGCLEESARNDQSFTFIHTQNAELVLHRFDQLNQSWIRSSTNSSTILKESDLHIFVPHMQPPLIVALPKEKSSKRPTMPDIFEEEQTFDAKYTETVLKGPYDKNKLLLMDDIDDYDYSRNRGMSIDSMTTPSSSDLQEQDGSIKWNQTEYFIEKLDGEDVEDIVKELTSQSTQQFVANLMFYISPNGDRKNIEKQHVIVTQALIRLILRVMPRFGDNVRHDYSAMFVRFIQHFKNSLENSQIFSARSLTYTTNMYFFAIIGTFTISQIGLGLLNDVGVLHLYVNMINSTTRPEHVKVIIASLDYSNEGLARTILRKALISSDEISKRWTTRYLSVLASADLVNFGEWGVQLMLRQLTDESAKVVRQAIRVLNQWLHKYPTKNLRKIQWDLYGEAGEMIKPHLFAIEEEVANNIEEVRELIGEWMKNLNMRFVDVIDEDFRAAMFSIKRDMDGEFSRSSTDRVESGTAMPIHLFAALASHETGRHLLVDQNVCAEMLDVLHCATSKNREIKGALFGLANVASIGEGVAILPNETIARIVKIAEEHGVLSVRGNAFLACVCISRSVEGAKRLAQLGWESNLHRFTIDIAKSMANEETPVKRRNTHNRHNSMIDNNNSTTKMSKSRTRSHSESRIERPDSISFSNSVSNLRHFSSDLGLREDYNLAEDNAMMMVSPVSIVVDGMDEYRIHSSSGATSRLSNERRRANTTNSNIEEEPSLGTRSSTVARCIREGLQIPREQLEAEGTLADTIKEFHFSSRMREKYHLAPFRSHAAMQINRNIGDPVRYIFMSKEEERNFANYRRQACGDSWLLNELEKEDQEDNNTKRTVSVVPLQTVALPAEVEIMCGMIFGSKQQRTDTMFSATPNNEDIEDRGARGGYAKIDQVSHIQRHSKYRCFHCSEDEQTEYPHPDAVQLRREVLNQVDMMEIKDIPTKRLIGLRQHHEWLFKWPCLYADVLELLDEYRFKPHSRSFLQQIFYDALQL